MTTEEQVAALPRRQVLCGIMAMGLLGTTTLTACSGGDDTAGTDTATSNPPATDPATGGSTPSAPAGLAQVSAIPVGGGTIVNGPDGPIVLVQPTAGDIKAYDARCTHEQETVGAPQNGVMTCPRHNSRFRAADGSVVNGPAGSPLKSIAVTVNGDSVVLA